MADPALKLLHLYAQPAWRDDAHVVGNPEGLRALAAAVNEAIAQGKSTSEEVTVSDGEGYRVRVFLDDTDWIGPSWTRHARPYTDEPARETDPTRVWPDMEFHEASPVAPVPPSASRPDSVAFTDGELDALERDGADHPLDSTTVRLVRELRRLTDEWQRLLHDCAKTTGKNPLGSLYGAGLLAATEQIAERCRQVLGLKGSAG